MRDLAIVGCFCGGIVISAAINRLYPKPNSIDGALGFGARDADIVQLPVVQLPQIALPFPADAVSPRRVYHLIQRILRMIQAVKAGVRAGAAEGPMAFRQGRKIASPKARKAAGQSIEYRLMK